MASLRSKDVLQINATIITGLLILLTIQVISNPDDVRFHEDNLLQKREKQLQAQILEKTISDLQEKQSIIPTNETDLINTYQNEITMNEIELIKTKNEISVRGVATPVQIDGSEIVYKINRVTLTQTIAIMMIIPFVGSITWEVISTFDKKGQDMDKATKGSRVWMIIGFIGVVFGLYFIQQIILH